MINSRSSSNSSRTSTPVKPPSPSNRQYALSITTHPQRYDQQKASLAKWVEGSEVELTRELETVRSASTTS